MEMSESVIILKYCAIWKSYVLLHILKVLLYKQFLATRLNTVYVVFNFILPFPWWDCYFIRIYCYYIIIIILYISSFYRCGNCDWEKLSNLFKDRHIKIYICISETQLVCLSYLAWIIYGHVMWKLVVLFPAGGNMKFRG